MPSMLLRFVRIFTVTVLLLLLTTAIVCQFWELYLVAPYSIVEVEHTGLEFQSHSAGGHHDWVSGYQRVTTWSVNSLRQPPVLYVVFGGVRVTFLPWWLLLVVWGPLTAGVWLLTRRRKAWRGAVPVEPTAKSP